MSPGGDLPLGGERGSGTGAEGGGEEDGEDVGEDGCGQDREDDGAEVRSGPPGGVPETVEVSTPTAATKEPDPAELAGWTPGSRVLDAAAGRGRSLEALLAAGTRPVLLDRSARSLREVPTEVAAAAPRVRGDLFALPFPASTFDGVLLRAVVHHLPEPVGALRECARVLRPGGTLVLVDHDAAGSPADRARRNAVERLRHRGHAWSHDAEGLSALGTGARLEVDRVVPWEDEVDLDRWLDPKVVEEPFRGWAVAMVMADLAAGGTATGAFRRGDGTVALRRRWASLRFRKPEGVS